MLILALPIGIYAIALLLHRNALQVERAKFGSQEDYDRFLMYAASFGPGGPGNVWMVLAVFCYFAAFISLIICLHNP